MEAFNAGELKMQESRDTQEKAKDFVSRQMRPNLNAFMQTFIQNQSLMFLSTSDKKGYCDCSIRSGEMGFVKIIDAKTLVYPEYKGNGVMASMGNIMQNPHIGLLFVDFLEDKVGLHVNGKAKVLTQEELDAKLNNTDTKVSKNVQEQGLWVLIEIDEAYIHCSKNIPLFQKNTSEDTKIRKLDYFKLQN